MFLLNKLSRNKVQNTTYKMSIQKILDYYVWKIVAPTGGHVICTSDGYNRRNDCVRAAKRFIAAMQTKNIELINGKK